MKNFRDFEGIENFQNADDFAFGIQQVQLKNHFFLQPSMSVSVDKYRRFIVFFFFIFHSYLRFYLIIYSTTFTYSGARCSLRRTVIVYLQISSIRSY